MTEEKTDWVVNAILDRDKLEEDIQALVRILKKQRVYCVVQASDGDEALKKAANHVRTYMKIPLRYVKALNPRRLST